MKRRATKYPPPTLPPDMAARPKEEQDDYLVECIVDSLGPLIGSEFLSRQMESCCAGVRDVKRSVAEIEADEDSNTYEQIRRQNLDEVFQVFDDNLRIFFMSAQLYVTRLVETVRWFKLLAGC